jgi:sphingomyelin phosphodiesterase
LSSKKSNILILSILTLSIAIAAPHTKSLKTPAKCYACDIGLKLILPRLKKENLSDSETVAILQEGCSIFKIQSKAVCFGAINNMKDQVVSVVKELNLSPKEVCSIIPGLQMCWPELSPWDRKTWRVRIPDKNLRFEPRVKFEPEIEKKGKLSLEGKMKSAKMETGSMKILHLSDIHIDPDYTPGASANCKEPLCCRGKSSKHTSFWDRRKNKKANYWYTHDVPACDIPEHFIHAAFKHISKTHKDLDLIYWTGDLPPHNVWEQELMDEHKRLIKLIADMLKQWFPNTPVHYTIGNHESHPVNSFPIHGKSAPLYTAMADAFQPLANLQPEELDMFRSKGFYSTLVKPGFRVVSLNTNLCNNQNFWLLTDSEDPDNSLNFLVSVLKQAEIDDEKVHVIGHIAPGITPDCVRQWSLNYNNIIRRFAPETVTGSFFGHMHVDMFEIITSDDTQKHPIAVNHLSPSLTTYDGGHPAYRVFKTDENHGIQDFWTYISYGTDEELNDPTVEPKWKLEYQASEFYNGTPDAERLQNHLKKSFLDETTFSEFTEIHWKSLLDNYSYEFDKERNGTRCYDDIRCKREFLCPYTSQKSYSECRLFD